MRNVKSQSTGKTSNLSNLLTLLKYLKYDNQLMIAFCCNNQNNSLLSGNGREDTRGVKNVK